MVPLPGKKTVFIILAVAGGTIVLWLLTYGNLVYRGAGLLAELPRAQASASSFLDHLNAGWTPSAYAAATPAFRTRLTSDEFDAFVKHYPVLQKQTNRTMTQMRVYQRPSGEQVIIHYQVANEQNSLDLMLSLVKVGTQWLVDSVNVL